MGRLRRKPPQDPLFPRLPPKAAGGGRGAEASAAGSLSLANLIHQRHKAVGVWDLHGKWRCPKKYFASIPHRILLEKLQRRFKDHRLLAPNGIFDLMHSLWDVALRSIGRAKLLLSREKHASNESRGSAGASPSRNREMSKLT